MCQQRARRPACHYPPPYPVLLALALLALAACGIATGTPPDRPAMAATPRTTTALAPIAAAGTRPRENHQATAATATRGASPGPASDVALTQTVIADRSSPIPQPPAGALTYQGRSVPGTLGSYTWTSAAGKAAHADAPGIVVPDATLTVPADAALTFSFDGTNAPALLTAHAYLLAGQPSCLPSLPVRCLPHGLAGIGLPAQFAGERAAITAALPAGDYVLVVAVVVNSSQRSPEQGTATYNFRLVVQ